MSIYTDMIAHIEANGIGVAVIYPQSGPCCLFGVKAKVEGVEQSKFTYDTTTIPELVQVVRQFMPTNTIKRHCLNIGDWDYRWVYAYNDDVIDGDKDHAIRLLQVAEKLRIKK